MAINLKEHHRARTALLDEARAPALTLLGGLKESLPKASGMAPEEIRWCGTNGSHGPETSFEGVLTWAENPQSDPVCSVEIEFAFRDSEVRFVFVPIEIRHNETVGLDQLWVDGVQHTTLAEAIDAITLYARDRLNELMPIEE